MSATFSIDIDGITSLLYNSYIEQARNSLQWWFWMVSASR